MVELPTSFNIKQKVDQILEVGYLSRQDYLQLIALALSDSLVTDDERSRINHILDELQATRIKLLK